MIWAGLIRPESAQIHKFLKPWLVVCQNFRNNEPNSNFQLIGQVENSKADPKYCTQRILKSERADLFAGDSGNVQNNEIQLLDDFLLKKGELKSGVSLTLGKVVEMDRFSFKIRNFWKLLIDFQQN